MLGQGVRPGGKKKEKETRALRHFSIHVLLDHRTRASFTILTVLTDIGRILRVPSSLYLFLISFPR